MMRFDLRAPGKDATERAALYQAMLDMAAWADDKGCLALALSEHHAADDGYSPSPFPLACAAAAVTTTMPITIAAALLPMYDPVRVTEDLITLDHVSAGRSMVVFGLGYRPEEYELHGVEFSQRGKVADAKLERVLELLTEAEQGEAELRITPPPFTPGGPMLAWGGMSKAAARRAGRNGVGFFAQTDLDGLEEAYREACQETGHEPGMVVLPARDTPAITFVAEDVDRAWDEIGPCMLADATSYHEWNEKAGTAEVTVSISGAKTVDELRAEHGSHRIISVDDVGDHLAEHGVLQLHPLCGGLDPQIAWHHLRLAVDAIGRAQT